MPERDRIARYFAPLSSHEPGSFSLTDDAAVLSAPSPTVVTTDSVIVGIHALPQATATQIAQKLVRRNLSDLAAMGAKPWRYLLNVHTPPGTDDAWFAEFSATLKREQEQFGMVLVGGDSTSGHGPVHVTMTCIGLLSGAPLRRSAAQVGDDVFVTGTIGDAALGLLCLTGKLIALHPDDAEFLKERYHVPQPPLEVMLQDAHAAMDISDGLLVDAAQLAAASGVQLALEQHAIPLSPAAQKIIARDAAQWRAVLTGGDDYELLFTAPAGTCVPGATRIGTVTQGSGVMLDGVAVSAEGWEHR